MPKPPRFAAIALALLALSAGCSRTTAEQHVAAASAHLAKGQTQAALIELKNALQQDPDLAQARLMLGKALLAAADPVAAEVELRKARSLGAPEAQVLPELARAMLLTGQPEKIAAQFATASLAEPEAQADLMTTVAAAHAQQGQRQRADQAVAAALSAKPDYPPALLVQARMKAAQGDIDDALALLDGVLQRDPGNAQAGVAKGYVLWLGRQDGPAALETYRRVLEAHPDNVPARAEMVTILFRQGEREPARQQFEQLKKAAPQHPETLFFEAQFAYVDRQYRQAREKADALLKALPDHVRTLELAAAAEYQMGNDGQAQAFLAQALKVRPELVLSRQILAQSYLRSHQPAKAIEALRPLLAKGADAETLAIAGNAYLLLGDSRSANDAFKRATQLAPDNTKVRTQAAVAMLGGDQAGVALRELEALARSDRQGVRADLALFDALVSRGDFRGALKAIDALQAKQPDQPLPWQLRGQVLVAMRDAAGARRSFEAALGKDPRYFPAVAALASMDVATGKPEQGRQRVIEFLKTSPNQSQAMMMLADIPTAAGTPPEDATKWLADAVRADPSDPRTHLALINRYLRRDERAQALNAAQAAAAALPNDPSILEMLGRTQILSGQAQQAVTAFRSLASLRPDSATVQVYLAEALVAAKDPEGARRALKKATEIDPASSAAWQGLVLLALHDDRPQEALTLAREMQKREPKGALGYALEGDIEGRRKNFAAAATAYRKALDLGGSSEAAVKLHMALRAQGSTADAARQAAALEKKFSGDPVFVFYLGDLATREKDFVAAERHYRAVLASQPKNALVMNNIAWLLLEQSKPGALEMAERANALLPNRAPILDTLAAAQAASGKPSDAVATQRRAIDLSPQDPNLKLHLARFQIKAGMRTEARQTLESLAQLGDRFAGQAEVNAMLKSL